MRACYTIIKHCMINKLLMAMSLFVLLSSCPLVRSYNRPRQFSLIAVFGIYQISKNFYVVLFKKRIYILFAMFSAMQLLHVFYGCKSQHNLIIIFYFIAIQAIVILTTTAF